MRAMLLDPEEDGELVAEVATQASAGAKWEETALAEAGGCGLQVEFDMLDMLEEMLEAKFEKLIQGGAAAQGVTEGVREQVRNDCEEYRRGRCQPREATLALIGVMLMPIGFCPAGQIAVLEAALEHREKLFEEAVASAKEAGIDMQFDEGEGEEDDEEEE